MNIEIINIGDEILIGQVINTNAAWMAEELNRIGFMVFRFTVVSDNREYILQALKEAQVRADLVLVSGGLGPTKDDITKETICDFFSTKLVFNEEAFRNIEALFARRGWSVNVLNRKQAELPENCISLPNRLGTARGMWFETSGQADKRTSGQADKGTSELPTANCQLPTVFIFLPGVPFELKEMFTREVIPRLKQLFTPKTIIHRTVLTQGMGESGIADLIQEWEENLPGNLKLAYLPQPGIVRLRLTGSGSDEEILRQEVESEIRKLHQIIPDLIYGYDTDTLEAIVGQLLMQQKQTLSIAESCTGGYISHLVTSIPGSSAYFQGSVVAYSNRSKEDLLYVKKDTLENHGSVSEQVAMEMALGAKARFRSDYSIATTGIAGPTGSTPDKPVGTVWIGIATPTGVFA
ncbi:MAG: nicotinamide-nucleotide amidohydrolase family protein, partial [Bacteroidales bacterium]|nr:nicotinamide-nucleotide amidohydrolase family protein [Bacteroidales bacterium]